MKKFLSTLGALLSLIYLFNPGAGIIELIPDNIPGIGNVDEASVTLLLVYCLANIGIKLPFMGKKTPKIEK